MYSHSTTNRPQSAVSQLPSLTALRGLAALWVVLFHYTALYFPRLDITGHSSLIGRGYLAVDLFFMLSGFVMTHVYCRAFCESVKDNYRSFLVARVARLYPLHVVVLLLFIATALLVQLLAYASTGNAEGIPLTGTRSLAAAIANLFMLQGLSAKHLSWNYPSWSISVEFMAYLAFPLVLPLLWRASGRVKLGLLLVIFAALSLFACLSGGDFNQWGGPLVLLRCLPEFLLGTLIYSAYRARFWTDWFAADAVGLVALAVAVLCLHLRAPDLLIVALFPVLVLAAVGNTGNIARVINVAPLVWLGEISYSLYLIHGFVQYAATQALGHFGVHDNADLSIGASFALLALMLAVCVAGAHLSYRGIEIGWRKHLRALLAADRVAKPKPAGARSGLVSRQAGSGLMRPA
jgi:peptidoglycan/LPS O-acetylase OafA/YrhL